MKAKILFIMHVPPPVHGAAMVGQYIKNSELINSTFDITYLNLGTASSLDDIGKGGGNKIFRLLKLQVRVFKELFKNDYKLCYLTLTAGGLGFYKDLTIVAMLKLFRKNIVYHFHNKGVLINSKSRLNRFLYRFVFRNTHSILLSPHLYYDIAPYVKKEKVFFCPNGIPDISNLLKVSDKAAPNKVCKLLFLSNMMREKGVLLLLKACHILKQKKHDFECHFIGAWSDISEEEFLRHVKEYDLSGYIYAHGKKYGEEKLDYIQESDIFVFPTFYHNETFGLVILEAMQAALPVVSTFEGGIADVVENGKTGFLVQQKNTNDLADKLEILINSPQIRKAMGADGRKRYQKFFTIEKFETAFNHILQEIMIA